MFDYIHTIIITLITLVVTFVIGLFIIIHDQSFLAATNLTDAVRTAMYDSRDDSARVARGVFILNKAQFIYELEHTKISDFNNQTPSVIEGAITNPKSGDVSVQFLQDTNSPIATNSSANTEAVLGVVANSYFTGHNSKKLQHLSTTEIVQTYGKSADKDYPNDLTR